MMFWSTSPFPSWKYFILFYLNNRDVLYKNSACECENAKHIHQLISENLLLRSGWNTEASKTILFSLA